MKSSGKYTKFAFKRRTPSQRCVQVMVLAMAAGVPVLIGHRAARADIYQWQNSVLYSGLELSTTVCPGGMGVIAIAGANLSNRDLTKGYFLSSDLTGTNFSQSNLTNAAFGFGNGNYYFISSRLGADLVNANFSGANLTGADFSGFIGFQDDGDFFYVGANLTGANLMNANLTGTRFYGANLTNADLRQTTAGANFGQAVLTGANLTGTDVRGTSFYRGAFNAFPSYGTYYGGITPAQLYATASYQAHDLTGIGLGRNNMAGANLTGQNLTSAIFIGAPLTGADLTGATIRNATFEREFAAFGGLSVAQLTSTASYGAHDLTGVHLRGNSLPGVNLAGQNLTGADLTFANLAGATLTNATLTGAHVHGANFGSTNGFTAVQLYSTATYSDHYLGGIGLANLDLSGWNFSGQNLALVKLDGATLVNTNLNFADLREATGFAPAGSTLLLDTIRPDGTVPELSLTGSQSFTINLDANYLPVTIQVSAVTAPGTLLVFRGEGYAFAPDIAHEGTLQVEQSATLQTGRISGSGVVTIGTGGTVVLRERAAPPASKLTTLSIAGSLNSWTGKLDITNNALVLQTSGPVDKAARIAVLRNQIDSGEFSGFEGPWTGYGITSSSIGTNDQTGLALADNADLHYTSFRGQTVNEASLILAQALFGDANLDGKVNAFDLNLLASHWQQGVGGALVVRGFYEGWEGKCAGFEPAGEPLAVCGREFGGGDCGYAAVRRECGRGTRAWEFVSAGAGGRGDVLVQKREASGDGTIRDVLKFARTPPDV